MILSGGCSDRAERGALSCCEWLTLDEEKKIVSRSTWSMCQPRRAPAIHSTARFVVGGCVRPGEHLRSIEQLTMNDGWTLTGEVAYPRSCTAFVEVDSDRLLIAGGFDGRGCLNVVQIVSSDARVQVLRHLSTDLKNAVAHRCKNDSILFFGGWDGQRTLSAVFEYNIATEAMEQSHLLPIPIEGHSLCQLDDNFLLISGGFDGISVIDSFILYNLSTGHCEVLDVRLAISRENHCSIMIDDTVVIMGGWNGREALTSIETFTFHNQWPYLSPIRNDNHLIIARNRAALLSLKSHK